MPYKKLHARNVPYLALRKKYHEACVALRRAERHADGLRNFWIDPPPGVFMTRELAIQAADEEIKLCKKHMKEVEKEVIAWKA